MWKDETIYLGNVKEKSSHNITYKWEGPELKIKNIVPSCGCTKPVWNPETKEITAIFKAGKVPKHLEYKGSFTTTKTISVYAENQKPLHLKLTVTINK